MVSLKSFKDGNSKLEDLFLIIKKERESIEKMAKKEGCGGKKKPVKK